MIVIVANSDLHFQLATVLNLLGNGRRRPDTWMVCWRCVSAAGTQDLTSIDVRGKDFFFSSLNKIITYLDDQCLEHISRLAS